MLQAKTFDNWKQLNDMWNEIADNYYAFSQKKKNELYDKFNIDSGHDYADYIFNIGNIEY